MQGSKTESHANLVYELDRKVKKVSRNAGHYFKWRDKEAREDNIIARMEMKN